jgi:uncharacterized membrane protein
MRKTNKQTLTWALIAVGVAILVTGGVMLATFPWQQGTSPWSHAWAQSQGPAPDGAPGAPQAQGVPQAPPVPQGVPGFWYGYHHGWLMRGPRFFGGGLLILVLVILAVGFFVRRAWYGSSRRNYDPDRGLGAEEILRRKFAQGDISEEEFKSRLSGLRK